MNATYLVLSKLSVKNANAMSSSITVGVPAMTAFMGFAHALERKVQALGFQDFSVTGTAVFFHSFEAQLLMRAKKFRHSVIGTANPLKVDGSRPSSIEEPRCSMLVSLLMKINGIDKSNDKSLTENLGAILSHMKLAGGDIGNAMSFFPKNSAADKSFEKIRIRYVNVESDADEKKLLQSFMPSYALVDRHDLLEKQESPDEDALARLIDLIAVRYLPKEDTNENTLSWEMRRKTEGWIVPVGVGFKDISGPVKMKAQRNTDYEHHFVEPLVTLGEFKMAHRINSIQDILWKYQTDLEQGLYLCRI